MIVIFMTSAKLATPGILKIMVFWKKDQTSQIMPMTLPAKLSHDSSYI